MIEKKIHYIWLGGKPKSKLSEICINSWYSILGDEYEIVEWNENNLELKQLMENCRFLRKCIKYKLWAFASDYLRLYILYNHGGIYMDTDVQLFKSFNSFLNYDCFFGLEEGEYIGTGIIGATKKSKVIEKLLLYYDDEIFNSNLYLNPTIFKYIFDKQPSLLNDSLIAPKHIFSPFNYNLPASFPVNSSDTVTIHWYSKNWNLTFRGECFIYSKHITNFFVKFFVYFKCFLKRILRKG